MAKTEKNETLVLVTGASGFIAGHCVKALLDEGYRVRGTVRSLTNRAKVGHLDALGDAADKRLELVEADLTSDAGWDAAVAGCSLILHLASPFPASEPEDEMELITPAVEGTTRVLQAAARTDGAVKRVVVTSSVAAVAYGHTEVPSAALTEADWSNVDNCQPYQKSKTLAERAAWDFVESLPDEQRFELAVINPGFVLGPMLSDVGGTSAELIKRLMKREMPACPELGWATVDVRDLAQAHLLAMTKPEAAGNRYICAGDNVWLQDMSKVLAAEFKPKGYNPPTGHMPYFVLWLAARFDKTLRLTLPLVGRAERVSNAKARKELGWTQRPIAETMIDMGNRAIELGMV